MNTNKLALTIEEAAEFTGIGRNTMRQLVDWGTMPVLRVGRKVLIQTDVLSHFLQANQNVNLRNRQEVKSIKA